MGWEGALAGLGQGMMSYADILGEKQKQDWLTQKDAVMHERNKELERLRNENNMKVMKEQQKMSDESWDKRFVKQEAAQIGAESREDVRWKDRFGLQQEAVNAAEDRRFSHEKDLLGMRQGSEMAMYEQKMSLELEKAEKLADLALEKDMEGKKKQLEVLQQSTAYQNSTPEEQKILDLATLHPEPFKLIASTQKDSGMKKEMMQQYSISYGKALESYAALDEKQQKAWNKQAKAAGLQDGRFAFAEYSAAQSINLGGLISDDNSFGSKVPKTNQQQTEIEFDPDMALKIKQAYKNGEISLSEIRDKTKGTPYEAVYFDLRRNKEEEPKPPLLMSSAVGAFHKFGTRHVEKEK